jgi:hypothetical protein
VFVVHLGWDYCLWVLEIVVHNVEYDGCVVSVVVCEVLDVCMMQVRWECSV